MDNQHLQWGPTFDWLPFLLQLGLLSSFKLPSSTVFEKQLQALFLSFEKGTFVYSRLSSCATTSKCPSGDPPGAAAGQESHQQELERLKRVPRDQDL